MHSYLQKVLQQHNPEPQKELINLLIKNMAKYYPERSHKTVHASDVTKPGFCARQYMLMDLYDVKRPDSYISAGLRATFDVGNATAQLVTEKWLGEQVVGHWKCRRCDQWLTFRTRPTYNCPHCNGDSKNDIWEHKEVVFKHPVYGVSGSIDALVKLGGEKLTVVELKIMKAEDWEALKAPLAEHRIRTALYLKLIAESGQDYAQHINHQHAKVLYVSRGFGKKSPGHGEILPFKEFDVQREDELVETYLKAPKLVADWRASPKTIPIATGVCVDMSCPAAKKCPVRKECQASINPPLP